MEDKILTEYIRVHGEGKWRNLPKRAGEIALLKRKKKLVFFFIYFKGKCIGHIIDLMEWMGFAGLKRCGKSCRLRWLNYLRPDIKRGNITRDEEELIIRLHKLLGNRYIIFG